MHWLQQLFPYSFVNLVHKGLFFQGYYKHTYGFVELVLNGLCGLPSVILIAFVAVKEDLAEA